MTIPLPLRHRTRLRSRRAWDFGSGTPKTRHGAGGYHSVDMTTPEVRPNYSAKIIGPNDGLFSSSPSETAYTKLTSADTGGQFLFAEVTVQPGGGPPYHMHEREDELFYVLEGEIEFVIDGKSTIAGPGTTVFGARNIPHRFVGSGNVPARMLALVTGSNFEAFYVEMERRMAEGELTEATLAEFAETYGIHFLPEP